MLLAAGTRLGPYEILAPIGEGGMGQVYKARDTRLDRVVAIKVLPENVASRPDFRQRFQREARAISSLSHPHICPLYDVGQQDGTDFLVMEYLEGETLAQRLKRGAMPYDQVLRYAGEIAAALDDAHRHGVVHRDLKPGNIMLTRLGVKVLDFGLAKVGVGAAGAGSSSDVATALVSEPITTEGAIVGTLQYMAPEQLEGKDADARADIFAFGAVVYEMASGRRAFEGRSSAGLIAAIMEHEVAPLDPPLFDHVIRVCLAKDPDDRWQTARDLGRELKWIACAAATLSVPAQHQPARKIGLAFTAAGILFLAGVAAVLIHEKTRTGEPRISFGRTTQVTFDPGLELDPVLSPDGKLVAYASGTVGGTHLYMRQLGSQHSIPLTAEVAGYQRWPQWSPDGSKIAFFSVDPGRHVSDLFVIPALGGVPKKLVEETGTHYYCPVWSPDGGRIAYASGNGIYVYSLAGAQTSLLAEQAMATHSLAWSPDGARIAYVVENPQFAFGVPLLGNISPSSIWTAPAAGGKAVRDTDSVHVNVSPAWMPDSRRLLYISNQSGRRDIYQLELRASGEPAGPPLPLTTGLNAMSLTVSRDGSRLAYSVLNLEENIWSIPIPAHPPVSASAATRVTTGNQTIEGIGISRDGQWLAFDSDRNGNADIYRMPVAGGEIEQLTSNTGDNFEPSWSPDGKEIAFHSWRNGSRDVFVMSADGSNQRQLTSLPGHEWFPDWSPDGQQIVFQSIQGARNTLALLSRTAGGGWSAPRDLAARDLAAGSGEPRWSPDGRSIAFGGGNGALKVISPEGGEARTLASNRAGMAVWSSDSRLIYYKSRDGFWSVPAEGGASTLLVRFDDPAQQSQRAEFAVSPERFYFTIGHYQSDIFIMEIQNPRR